MNSNRDRRVLLIIDDDRLLCDAIKDHLNKDNLKVLAAHSIADGTAACSQNKVDIVMLDQNLPDGEGHTLCPSILKYNDQTKIIFITAYPSFENAVRAIKAGAYDYLSKPFEMEELYLAVKQALKTLSLEKTAHIESYRKVKDSEEAVLVGTSREFMETIKAVSLAASTDAPVLITGETGTGKNVAAKAIHYKSLAKEDAFISINCAALPENLIEAELFGYEKGAFTGATASKRGIFEMAEGGTLLLDEIGEMPLHLQSKFLSVLEDKKIRRLGGDLIRPVNFRVIAATSADLENVMGPKFRSDLYYRLSVIRIHIPPLRERRQDIPEICSYLLKKIEHCREIRIEDAEMEKLMNYKWPGNVRELRNILERACLLQSGPIITPSELLGEAGLKPDCHEELPEDPILPLEEVEKQHIHSTLKKLSFNISKTSAALQISISTLKRKIKEYGLR